MTRQARNNTQRAKAMNRLNQPLPKRQPVKADYYLNNYAPGDGAIAFTYVNKFTNLADGLIPVTREDVENFINTEEGKKRYGGGCKLLEINGDFRIVWPVERVNENTLKHDGSEYTYTVEHPEDFAQALENGIIPDSYITYRFVHNGQEHKMHNWGIKAMLNFFLKHEEILAKS